MAKVVAFGEIMLRLSPPGYQRFVQTTSFDAVYGGAEANTCVSLANFGVDTAFVTKVPDNALGQAVVNELRRYGVDTQHIIRGGERLGIYFLEKGAAQRPSKVIYDRKHSSIAQAEPGEFDWKAIFEGAEWFHFTGITPALGDNTTEMTFEACCAARNMGLKVSCDLNYRQNLWTSDKAGSTMSELMKYVDVCIANEEHASQVLGVSVPFDNTEAVYREDQRYKAIAQELVNKYGFEQVVLTLRSGTSSSDNNVGAMLYDGTGCYFSKDYSIHIVDRIGGGDALTGGIIYARLCGYDSQKTIDLAAAASCLKHSMEGDFSHATAGEVNSLMEDGGSGRVQR